MRLIDGDALYKAMKDAEELARRRVRDTESTLPYPTNLNPAYTRYLAQMDERMKAKEMVADAPTVDAVPVVHSEWIPREKANTPYGLEMECAKCGFSVIVNDALYFKFCPNCGADMRGEHEKAD